MFFKHEVVVQLHAAGNNHKEKFSIMLWRWSK